MHSTHDEASSSSQQPTNSDTNRMDLSQPSIDGANPQFDTNGFPLLPKHLHSLKSNVKVLKRIPKAARLLAAQELARIVDAINKDVTSYSGWWQLLTFAYVAFKSPDKKNKQTSSLSLATIVKRNLTFWSEIKNLAFADFLEKITPTNVRPTKVKKDRLPDSMIIKKVQSKMNEGDFKGAIRLLTSNDTIAPFKVDTYLRLLEKHPEPNIPVVPVENADQSVTPVLESEVNIAIFKFENGSAGGMDALRPQHLKDMIMKANGESATKLIRLFCTFSNGLLNGNVPSFVTPILYGASLCALNKKDNSLRPIAIGSVLRRMVSKIACARVYDKLGSCLRPKQVGFGTRGGAEAGAHAARRYINHEHLSTKVMLKIDYANAFNELERNPMLVSVLKMCPEIHPYLNQCYSTPSILWFGDFIISSQRGCQQGDPCGPPLFCMAIHEMVSGLLSEMNIWYLDDGTLAGDPQTVLQDLKTIIRKSAELGLRLNFSKCEIKVIGNDINQEIVNAFNDVAPGITALENNINLLGAPLTDSGISNEIKEKIIKLKLMVFRLKDLNSHQSFFLLRNSFSIPKLTYLLRTTPCWRSMPDLVEYNQILKSAVEGIINCNLSDTAWMQTTISVNNGGLGLRDVTKLCLSSFLGSSHSVAELLAAILPAHINQLTEAAVSEAEILWQASTFSELIPSPSCKLQKNWDMVMSTKSFQDLLENATTDVEKARLLACGSKESGSWLSAFPASSLGTLLDDQSFRISMALRLGVPVCHPHTCICGSQVDKSGIHGLACKKSIGRKSRHEMVNDLLKRALVSCGIPAIREPNGCNRSDGKKPDGLTLIPWKRGKPLVWDFTCADTFCKSYLKSTSKHRGGAANTRETRKKSKYASLEDRFCFVPIAIETMGSWGTDGRKLVENIGNKLMEATGETRSKSFLYQRISIAIQRGNSAAILGTIPESFEKFDAVYYIL